MRQQPLPDDILLTDAALGGVPILEIAAPGAQSEAGVLYVHGGVFALGSARAGAGLASLVARQARAKVLFVEYLLAPEHPYPAAVDDALTAYRGLLATGIAPALIAFVASRLVAGWRSPRWWQHAGRGFRSHPRRCCSRPGST
jgi:epsilon-lactone hydrolase